MLNSHGNAAAVAAPAAAAAATVLPPRGRGVLTIRTKKISRRVQFCGCTGDNQSASPSIAVAPRSLVIYTTMTPATESSLAAIVVDIRAVLQS